MDITEELAYGERLAVLFVLYVMALARLWDPALPFAVGPTDWAGVHEGGTRRVAMQLALSQLRRDCEEGRTVREVLGRVLEAHVIAQHERVALAKLPDDTYRFRREAARLRFYDRSTVFRRNDTRFHALSTTCAELAWSGFFGDNDHALSHEGEAVRATGDLP